MWRPGVRSGSGPGSQCGNGTTLARYVAGCGVAGAAVSGGDTGDTHRQKSKQNYNRVVKPGEVSTQSVLFEIYFP